MRKNRHERAVEKMDQIAEDLRHKFIRVIESQEKVESKLSEAEYLLSLIERDSAKSPTKDKLSERSCPSCGAYINWDALNDPINYAPDFCKCCGQRFDWTEEQKWKDANY